MTRARLWIIGIVAVMATGSLATCTALQREDGGIPVPNLPPTDCADVYETHVYVPDTIDPTGTEDVTAELEAWLEGLPPRTVAHLRPGTYRSESQLDVTLDRVTLDGDGARLVRTVKGDPADDTVRYRSSLILRGGQHVTVKDLTIVGASEGPGVRQWQPEYEAQHGIEIRGALNLTVCDVTVERVLGDFIYVTESKRGGEPTGARDVNIHSNSFVWSGRQGIAIVWADGVTVQQNLIWDAARSAIDIEPVSGRNAVSDVVIDGNRILSAARFVSSMGAPAVVDGLVVSNNRLREMSLWVRVDGEPAPAEPTKRDVVVVGNTADRLGSRVYLGHVSTAWVVGNTGPVKGTYEPVETPGSTDVHVFANRWLVP